MTAPAQTPDDRSATFQAVQGNPTEQYSGGALLVAAYAVLWVIIFAWIGVVWRRQRGIDTRLAELERVIDAADKERSR
jgi:hypothetical protein